MFRKLKGKLRELELTQEYLCKKLHRSKTYISDRMTGRKSWELDECFEILQILGEPANRLIEYFPKGGRPV